MSVKAGRHVVPNTFIGVFAVEPDPVLVFDAPTPWQVLVWWCDDIDLQHKDWDL